MLNSFASTISGVYASTYPSLLLYNLRMLLSAIAWISAIVYYLDYQNLDLNEQLQRVQNASDRFVVGAPSYSHISPIFFDLQWLPIVYRIKLKMLLTTFKALHGLSSAFIQDLVVQKQQRLYNQIYIFHNLITL